MARKPEFTFEHIPGRTRIDDKGRIFHSYRLGNGREIEVKTGTKLDPAGEAETRNNIRPVIARALKKA